MTLKKAIIKRSELPPLYLQNIENAQYITIENAQYLAPSESPFADTAVILYTTLTPHSFKSSDTVEIKSDQTDPFANVFTSKGIEVFNVPANNQFYVQKAITPTSLEDIVLSVAPLAEQYLIRYRIVSEDLNRTSHWSPIYALTNVYQELASINTVTLSMDAGETFINARWNMPNEETSSQNYDVYVAWGNLLDESNNPVGVGNYNYYSTVSGNITQIPVGATVPPPEVGGASENFRSIKVAIQRSTLPNKQRVASLTIAESEIYKIPYA